MEKIIKKKRVEVEVAKKKKRVKIKTLAHNKIDDKAIKNIEATSEKAQISKHKTTLLAFNLLLKKATEDKEDKKTCYQYGARTKANILIKFFV